MEALVHRLAGALEACRGAEDHVGTQEADEERKVGVAEERDEGVGEVEELGDVRQPSRQRGLRRQPTSIGRDRDRGGQPLQPVEDALTDLLL